MQVGDQGKKKRIKVIYAACTLFIQVLPQAFCVTHGTALPKLKILRLLKRFPLMLFSPSVSCGFWPLLQR